MDEPVGPKGPFSGIASATGSVVASWYVWDQMRSAPIYVAGPVAGLAGTVGYVGGLAIGGFVDDLYKNVVDTKYNGKPAIAYSNAALIGVTAAGIPVSMALGKAATAKFGAGLAANMVTAGGLGLLTTVLYMLINGDSSILDSVGSWFGGSKPEASNAVQAQPEKPAEERPLTHQEKCQKGWGQRADTWADSPFLKDPILPGNVACPMATA